MKYIFDWKLKDLSSYPIRTKIFSMAQNIDKGFDHPIISYGY